MTKITSYCEECGEEVDVSTFNINRSGVIVIQMKCKHTNKYRVTIEYDEEILEVTETEEDSS